MSSDERGGLEPELPRKNVVGLFCGAAFHDAVFARVPGFGVVRLYDWKVRMLKLACLFFPEEGVVKGMDIRAGNMGALAACSRCGCLFVLRKIQRCRGAGACL